MIFVVRYSGISGWYHWKTDSSKGWCDFMNRFGGAILEAHFSEGWYYFESFSRRDW